MGDGWDGETVRHTCPDEVRHACMCRHAVSMGKGMSPILTHISSSSRKRGTRFGVGTYHARSEMDFGESFVGSRKDI